MPKPEDYENLSVEEVPLEQLREVIEALRVRLGLTLHRYQWHDGSVDFEFRSKE
jgi:hypothetical protein